VGNDPIFIGGLIDNFHQVAAIRAQKYVNLFLHDHPLTDLLALVWLRHVIGLDDLNHLLFTIHENAAPFVDVMSSPLDTNPVQLPVYGSRP